MISYHGDTISGNYIKKLLITGMHTYWLRLRTFKEVEINYEYSQVRKKKLSFDFSVFHDKTLKLTGPLQWTCLFVF